MRRRRQLRHRRGLGRPRCQLLWKLRFSKPLPVDAGRVLRDLSGSMGEPTVKTKDSDGPMNEELRPKIFLAFRGHPLSIRKFREDVTIR